ncbi:MAG: DNA mismatch repair endonuclease MutL [Elusimicrobiaceae bacterium]|nr:DNA mismatch repair endonuclease MutL [Elusimicrobiaceae bacterium]
MNDIKVLDFLTSSKIAAGEVIERPAGVLKELLENAIDAGANAINIDISKAGKTLIRVNDNGVGIKAEDLQTALLRHSTSKIKNFEDLNNLHTFGFRGEALFSIAAVSKLTLTSFQEGSKGASIKAEGGKILQQTSAPEIKGTTVAVENLFYNTPARLKFLKTDAVERGHLLNIAEEAALANLKISFKVRTDNTLVYNLPPVEENESGLRQRASKIIGQETAKDLLYLEDKNFGFKALISPANKLCASRNLQYFFINKRPVTCKILQQALFKAYQPFRAQNKYPCAIIYLTLNPADFDVNIHPQKREVKFAFENDIFNFLYKTLSKKLLGTQEQTEIILKHTPVQNIPEILPQKTSGNKSFNNNFETKQQPHFKAVEELSALLKVKPLPRLNTHEHEDPAVYGMAEPEQETPEQTELTQSKKDEKQPSWWHGPYKYLGQLHKSYLLFEGQQGLVLIDQHAAQERIYFEEFCTLISKGEVARQPLMFPLNIDLPASKLETVLNWESFLKETGFEVSKFSSTVLLVSATPALLKMGEKEIKDFILSFAETAGNPLKADNVFRHKFIATKACKKAVKAGEELTETEATALLENLKNCQDALHCPHGRPTMLNLTLAEISQKIGRG